jgi:hypothetical protein
MKTQKTKTIENLLDSESMRQITNRGRSVDHIIEEVKADWAYNLFERKPAPAYIANGELHTTNLDLASMMSALADRNAVINIPNYDSRRATTKKENEWVVSDKNRHGKLIGLNANKDVFSFSAKIVDQNVINTDTNEAGAYRNFLLTDLNGKLYNGFDKIEMHPTAKENKFIRETGIGIGNTIYFSNFVTPQLWSGFFGEPYTKLKALETRLNDEANFYRNAAAEVKEGLGIVLGKRYAKKLDTKGPAVQRGESVPVIVSAFEAEMDVPLRGKYQSIPFSKEGYQMAKAHASELTYSVIPRLRFSSRAVELAFSKYGMEGQNKVSWKTPKVERNYVLPGKRIGWNRMSFGDGYALRFRDYEKTERVNPRSF